MPLLLLQLLPLIKVQKLLLLQLLPLLMRRKLAVRTTPGQKETCEQLDAA